MFDLHFADSELLAPRWEGGTLVLTFAAAVVRPRVRPGLPLLAPVAADRLGQGAGLGHVRGLALRLHGARVKGDIASAFGRLAAGQWQADGPLPRHTLSVPMTADQPVQLSLALANGTALDIQATAWRAIFSGAPDYRESLAC